jgi:hypothetical protein
MFYLIFPAGLWSWGSTQPLTEMSNRSLPGGKGRPELKTDNLSVIYEAIVQKLWESHNPIGFHSMLRGIALLYGDGMWFL